MWRILSDAVTSAAAGFCLLFAIACLVYGVLVLIMARRPPQRPGSVPKINTKAHPDEDWQPWP